MCDVHNFIHEEIYGIVAKEASGANTPLAGPGFARFFQFRSPPVARFASTPVKTRPSSTQSGRSQCFGLRTRQTKNGAVLGSLESMVTQVAEPMMD